MDLEEAVVTESWKKTDALSFERMYLASAPDDCIVVRNYKAMATPCAYFLHYPRCGKLAEAYMAYVPRVVLN